MNNSNTRLTYTKQIRSNKLRTSEMEMGASITGVLKGFKVGKFGNNIVLDVNGRDIEIFPSGNLKFLEADVQKGRYQIGAFTVITRTEDATSKNGFPVTRYAINQDVNGGANTAPKTAATTNTTATAAVDNSAMVKARLEEIRSRKTNTTAE